MYGLMLQISDPIGIIGVAFILFAYYYLSIGIWKPDIMRYQILNFVGAWFILFSLYFHWNLSSFVIEIAWILISILGMYRIRKEKKRLSLKEML